MSFPDGRVRAVGGVVVEYQDRAGIGAVSGGILGALIDSNQPWRGAIIGAAAGAAAGGWIAERTDKNVPAADSNSAVIDQASREATRQNATIKYSRTTENGVNEEVIATPIYPGAGTTGR